MWFHLAFRVSGLVITFVLEYPHRAPTHDARWNKTFSRCTPRFRPMR
jgi:hypothetical protein